MFEEQAWLARLSAGPRDEAAWLAYAEWLGQRGDLRGEFLSRLLALGQGTVPAERLRRTVKGLRGLRRALDAAWLDRVIRLRAGRPPRIRIVWAICHRGTSEMFDYARTAILGVLEVGTVRVGDMLLLPLQDGGTVAARVVGNLAAYPEKLRQYVVEASAGQEPLEFMLYWTRYFGAIQHGGLIIPANAPVQPPGAAL